MTTVPWLIPEVTTLRRGNVYEVGGASGQKLLRDDGAVLGDLRRQVLVFGGVDTAYAGAQDGDGATVGIQACLMRDRVDATGQA